MGNLVSLMAHLPRGVRGDRRARRPTRCSTRPAATPSSSGRRSGRSPSGPDGTIDPAAIVDAFRDPTDVHEPITGLVAIENTNAHIGGRPLPRRVHAGRSRPSRTSAACPLHIDGARFFNAVVALGVTPAELAGTRGQRDVLPVEGPRRRRSARWSWATGTFVARARRARKLLGGGMRQAGVLAAAGLLALRRRRRGHDHRLAEDHANARRLAEGLAELRRHPLAGRHRPARRTGRSTPDASVTDFVLFKVDRDRSAFLDALEARGVLMVAYPHGQVRAVTHYGISAADIERTIGAVAGALASTAPQPAGDPRPARPDARPRGRRRIAAPPGHRTRRPPEPRPPEER